MEGRFRKRANTVWCPKPNPAHVVTQDDIDFFTHDFGYKVGQIVGRDKKVTGWINMDNCSNCPHLEEYHIEELGVFCLYPRIRGV